MLCWANTNSPFIEHKGLVLSNSKHQQHYAEHQKGVHTHHSTYVCLQQFDLQAALAFNTSPDLVAACYVQEAMHHGIALPYNLAATKAIMASALPHVCHHIMVH